MPNTGMAFLLVRRGQRFARYADDVNVYVQSKRAGNA
jgi:hypothetical protein